MSRRPKSNASPIALFTFLDTLMCTMGALILLLIALSIRMRHDGSLEELLAAAATEPAADAPPEEPAPSPAPAYTQADRDRDLAEQAARRQSRVDEWSATLAAARAQRDAERDQLRSQRDQLAKAQGKLQDVRARAKEADDQGRSIEQEQRDARAAEEKLKALDEQYARQIAITRRNLDLEHRKQAARPNEFALVPYDGTSGTLRRPIYIECTHRGFRFIPENVTIAADDLDGFRDSFNPLLTGTQSLLHYWNMRRSESGGDEPEPYVLLIVRPSGSLNYYRARQALTPVGAHFGYELVEEDWKLALADPDPQAVAAVRDAIELTIDARQRVQSALASNSRSRASAYNANYRNLPQNPFSEELDDELADGSGSGSRRGGSPGGRATDGEFRGGNGPGQSGQLTNGKGPAGSPGAASAATGASGAAGRRGNVPGEMSGGQRTIGGGGAARPGGAATGEPGLSGGPPTGQSAEGARSGTGVGAGQGGAGRAVAANLSGRPGGAGGAGDGSGGWDPEASDPSVNEAGGDLGSAAGARIPAGGAAAPPGGGAGGNGPAGSGRAGGTAGRPGARPASMGGSMAVPPEDEGDSRGAGGNVASPGRPRRATDEPGDGGEEPPLIPLPDEVTRPYGHVPRPPSGRNPEQEPGRLRELEPDPAERVERNASDNRTNQFGATSGDKPWVRDDSAANASDQRGGGARFPGTSGGGGDDGPIDPAFRGGKRRWGKAGGRAGIGLERKVEIHVKADHMLIGSKVAVRVSSDQNAEELLRTVLGGLDETAQGWGEPPANFFWLPSVRFVVFPGGEPYYERVRGPLQKSGVNSTVQYHLDKQASGDAATKKPVATQTAAEKSAPTTSPSQPKPRKKTLFGGKSR